MFPFSFTAQLSKDKEVESLNQEAKAKFQAKAERRPEGEGMLRPVDCSPAAFLPPVSQGLTHLLASLSQSAGMMS